MVSGYPVLVGQSRSQFTSSSASTTLSLAAIGLHSEETVSHTFPHCAANAEITNFFFFFIVSNPLSCGRHTSDCSKIFFKRARKPRNKTTRFKFTDIAEYVKKQQYFTLQHHRVMCQFIQASRTSPCFPPVLRQTPTYIDDKNKNYTYIHIYI